MSQVQILRQLVSFVRRVVSGADAVIRQPAEALAWAAAGKRAKAS
jgi:hypothetical protein